MKDFLYYAYWFFQCKFLGKRKPLQSVIFITDRCNLHCVHCNVVKEGPSVTTMTFEQVKDNLQYCYDSGSRIVDFEGGEPHLWKEGDANINTLIKCAQEMGFFTTTVTTNAQLPITAEADLIWVSIDGLEGEHDVQRGPGSFKRAMKNISESNHPNLNVNMAITNQNYKVVAAVVQLVKDNPKLKRFSASFYTPYESHDLCLTPEQRSEVVDSLIDLKKKGYPIMNSNAGLKLIRDPKNFADKRQCWISNFILSNGTRLDSCAGAAAGICDECGLSMGAEMSLLFSLHPEMVKAGLSVRSAKS